MRLIMETFINKYAHRDSYQRILKLGWIFQVPLKLMSAYNQRGLFQSASTLGIVFSLPPLTQLPQYTYEKNQLASIVCYNSIVGFTNGA